MSDQYDSNMTDHEYDGIRELDNNLPAWWLAIFGGTIIFSGLYWLHYQVAGPNSDQELAMAMEKIQAMKKAGPVLSGDRLLALLEEASMEIGKEVYAGKCAACHGPEGAGLIGPNLTDKFWVHGKGAPQDLLKVIADGVPEKGMPPWAAALSEEEMVAVTGYVKNMAGQNLPGKPPEGTEVP